MPNQAEGGGTKALVLFSGGQDSTICLAWALDKFGSVETVGFDYRPRHRVELECRTAVRKCLSDEFPKWSSKLSDDHLLDLDLPLKVSSKAI